MSSGRRLPPPNFEFAFNDSNFSDRMLRIEVMAEPSTLNFEDGTATIADWARNRKRRRAEAKRNAGRKRMEGPPPSAFVRAMSLLALRFVLSFFVPGNCGLQGSYGIFFYICSGGFPFRSGEGFSLCE
jgi:hypothetical protein